MSILEKLKKLLIKPADDREKIQNIDVSKVWPNPYQPRRIFDEVKLQELADSIKLHGVFQPIIVREKKGRYEIVSGERRWRATKLCELKTVPAIVGNFTDGEMLQIAMLENMQRVNLEDIEEAEAYTRLWDKFKNLTLNEISKKVGKKPQEVIKKLSFLYLPSMLREAVKQDVITEDQAKILNQLVSKKSQIKALEKIQQKKNSLLEYTERIVELLKEENISDNNQNELLISALQILNELISSMEDVGLEVNYKEEKKLSKRVITLELPDNEIETKILKVKK